MKNHFALTLNPAPFHKWNKELINSYYTQGVIYAPAYSKLPHFVQKQLLEDIYNYFKNNIKGDYSEMNFELTKLNHYHIHAHFHTDMDEDEMLSIVEQINSHFSNSNKWKALYIELTHTCMRPWHKYEKKDHYLDVLMNNVVIYTDPDVEDV